MKLLKVFSAVKSLIILTGLSVSFCLIAGEPFILVSEEEYLLQLNEKNKQRNEMGYSMEFRSSTSFGTDRNIPLITIKSPSIKSGLYSPIKIEINFKASDDADIQVNSLKVLYGWLNLDITDRILKHTQLTHAGISAENVKLPIGEHDITIKIRDTKGRHAEKEISFEILK